MRTISWGVVCGGLLACGSTPGDSTGSASTSGSDSASETGGGAPTTGEDATSGSGSASATGTSAASSTSEATSGASEATGTTGEVLCSLEHEACTLAGQLGAFEDCGLVDPWNDTVEAWQAAQACALAAASGQQPFKLITILQGIDSEVGQAYVGQAARSYAISSLFFDGDPCGGGGCGPVVSSSSCAGLTAVPGCTVEPGNVCLSCDGQGMSAQVCGPE
ncbi:hypothetical protein [Nannocystis sp.]|uniref:hypothetical protein n=1 Tax=Nannocystis sp. TaxID=1962667 RepID=UPI0024245992|nr:hypothetical protein [Nannocystis sp.]MBK7826253.1 hypothetical protein [Nannocystis sp.]MBK9758234.1 hypothetical protein [Nannocystis sp.]